MPKSTATNPVLTRIGSHSVILKFNSSTDPQEEEVFPEFTVTWRGQEIRATFRANRYVANDATRGNVWTPWHVVRYSFSPGVSDIAASSITDVCETIVTAWLNGGTVRDVWASGVTIPRYSESRQRAFASMIRNVFTERHYTLTQPEAILRKHKHELTPDDQQRFASALFHLGNLITLLDTDYGKAV